jgi:hypothetical protein
VPGRSHCFMYRIFRPFRLQSPSVAPTAWPVFHSRTYRRNRSEERVPPTEQGNAGVSWASPLGCRLAATIGRIEFVILRTSRSPPDALHLPSRGRSFVRLRQPGRPPTGTCTLLLQYTCNRTAPDGSPGVRPRDRTNRKPRIPGIHDPGRRCGTRARRSRRAMPGRGGRRDGGMMSSHVGGNHASTGIVVSRSPGSITPPPDFRPGLVSGGRATSWMGGRATSWMGLPAAPYAGVSKRRRSGGERRPTRGRCRASGGPAAAIRRGGRRHSRPRRARRARR